MRWPFRREPEMPRAEQDRLGKRLKRAMDEHVRDAEAEAAAGDEQEDNQGDE